MIQEVVIFPRDSLSLCVLALARICLVLNYSDSEAGVPHSLDFERLGMKCGLLDTGAGFGNDEFCDVDVIGLIVRIEKWKRERRN